MPATVSRETLDRLLIPSTATLTSVLRNLGITHSFMHRVRPLKPNMKMAGPAYTLRYIPAREDLDEAPLDNLKDKQRIGIEEIAEGEVLVIDARGDTRAGTMGAILATRIHCRGAVGIVTDGAYRDSPVIAETGMAAYSAAMNAHTNKTIHYPSEVQVPVACGDVAVLPGDIIVGDAEGVVVVPSQLAEDVARRAAEMELKEDFIIEKIRGGASIIGTYPADDETLAEFQEWKRNRRP